MTLMTTIILHLGIKFHLKLNEHLDVNLYNYSPGMHFSEEATKLFTTQQFFFWAENLIKLCMTTEK